MNIVVLEDDADTREAMAALLKDSNVGVRIEAAKALGEMGSAAKAALPALTEAQKDTSEQVKNTAKEAIEACKAIAEKAAAARWDKKSH